MDELNSGYSQWHIPYHLRPLKHDDGSSQDLLYGTARSPGVLARESVDMQL